jgi:alpha-glucosidase (family GH31 glycosyl hydrolase)
LIGEDLLVAPVVYQGKRERNIYLPPGSWRDHWSGKVHRGPLILENYLAPLDRLPFFYYQGAQDV